MTLQAEVDHDEQSLIDYSEMRFERAWSRSAVSNAALSAVAGTEFVRARMPAPQREPSGERRIDSPPLHDGEHHDEDEAQQSRRGGFLRQGPLALALALLLILATQAAISTGITPAASNRPMTLSSRRAPFPWLPRFPATSPPYRSPTTSMSVRAM